MRHVAALLALVIWFLAASPAQAQARGWRSATLPFGEIDRAAMAVVSGAEPSEMHRLGTAIVLACEHEQLIAEEWELAGPPRLLREKVLATLTRSSGAVVAERAGSDVYVLTAALDDADDDQVVLFTLDASLTVRAREVIGHGVVPSIAVDERRVLTAFHERRAPMASLSRRAPPARLALHVAVRDRAAMQVVSARIFAGDELLYTSAQPERSMHAIALDGDRAIIALTGLAKVIVSSVALPSLRETKTVRFGGLGEIEAAPVFALPGHRVLLDAPDRRRVLGADLEPVRATSDPTLALSAAGPGCLREVRAWASQVAICGGSTAEGPAAARFAVK